MNLKCPNDKGRSKIISVLRWHGSTFLKSKELMTIKTLLEVINEFDKLSEYKISMQLLVTFLKQSIVQKQGKKCNLL
jgi:hypothetical protein